MTRWPPERHLNTFSASEINGAFVKLLVSARIEDVHFGISCGFQPGWFILLGSCLQVEETRGRSASACGISGVDGRLRSQR